LTLPSCVVQDFDVTPSSLNSLTSIVLDAELDETAEDVADQLGLAFVWDQPAVLDVVAKWRHAAHPHALALTGGDLVANTLAGHLPLELGEGQEDVQHQPPHRGGGVELLRDRDEGHPIPLEHFDHLGEVRQTAC